MNERLTSREMSQEASGQEKPTFGDMLRMLRERQGLSARVVARRIGISPPAISHWENGKRRPESTGLFLSLLQILNPTEDEKSKLLEFMGMQHISESDNPDLILDLLERRLAQAERISSALAQEINEIRILASSLRISSLLKGEVVFNNSSV